MSEPYLIAHKVRGEPAFDIAIKMNMDGEDWWIIPTSGHRAYPYSVWKLYDICPEYLMYMDYIPDGTPDHYEHSAAPKGQGQITNLSRLLNLIPSEPIERRSL